MSFDFLFPLGPDAWACVYEVDIGFVRDEPTARRAAAEVAQRVETGKALRPDAAHYVTLLGGNADDAAVRDILVPALTDNVNIDSIAVQQRPPTAVADAPADTAGFEAAVPPEWAALADACDRDAVLSGQVIAAGPDGVQVNIDGAVGWLQGGQMPSLGEGVAVRIIAFNFARRHFAAVRVTPLPTL